MGNLMYWPDIIILAIIAFFTIKSAIRGIIREISSVVALLAGFVLASAYYIRLGTLLSGLITNAGIRHLLSFAGIFLLVYLVFILLGMAGKKIMKVSLLGWFDRTAGALLGFVKGTFIVCVILILITAFLPQKGLLIQKTKSYKYLKLPMEIMLCLVPHTLKESFHERQRTLFKPFDTKEKQDKGIKDNPLTNKK